MKLSLPLITERLNFQILSELSEDASNELRLPRPVFHTNEKTLKSDTLYICKGTNLPPKIKVEDGSALICIGYPEKTSADRPLNDILILDESVDIFQLSNAICQIYDFFDSWEESLNQLLCHMDFGPALKFFLDISEKVFENGIVVLDSNNNILAQSELYKNNGQPDLSQSALTRNILNGDSILYKISVIPCNRPLKKCDGNLLEILSDHIEHYVKLSSGPVTSDNINLARIFIEAIETGLLNKLSLESELKKSSLSSSDTFQIAYIHPLENNIQISQLTYMCREFSQNIENSFSFVYKGIIVSVIASTLPTQDDLHRKLIYYLRKNSFKAGISNPCSDLFEIQKYYIQAKMALDMGILEKTAELVYVFSNYTLNYSFKKITEEFSVNDLLSPIYYRLESYDKINKTDYLETLRVYLMNNQNAVQTAKDLFIHRATIIYRLKRICEIGQTELTDPNELLHLYMTFHMIDNE